MDSGSLSRLLQRLGLPAHFRLGLVDKLFLVALALYAVVALAGLSAAVKAFTLIVTAVLGIAAGIVHLTRLVRKVIWRLRNRMIVAYLFIAVVPILLVLILGQLGAVALTSQIGAYLLSAETDRRVASLRGTAAALARAPQAARAEAIRRSGFIFRERFPGLEILVRDASGAITHYPEESTLTVPPPGFGEIAGIVVKDGYFHLWAHSGEKSEVVVMAPITRAWLVNLVPDIGDVTLRGFVQGGGSREPRTMRVYATVPGEMPNSSPTASRGQVPPAVSRLDSLVAWGVSLPVSIWEEPTASETAILGMRSRISAVLNIIFSLKAERDQPLLLDILVVVGVIFLIVQVISAIIGISLSRTITSAVHNLYEGTQHIKEGDFAHRIDVQGNDQLAELSRSFNGMTQNLERLLKLETERQRMQAELEIAREVQSQLHPKPLTGLGALRITSVCNPARMVSGDYYDYQTLSDQRLALAVGDVAGKGISAALLMATLQSAMRSQLRSCMDAEPVNGFAQVSTSKLVSNLNQQVFASTSPEKYATFYFSVYDDETGLLTYTNAGHLPPILLRRGQTSLLDINGMVVGAFPFAQYGESQLAMESGDLLLFYTDGITEPENAYGEMFGEDRLIDLLLKNAGRTDQEIVSTIVSTVEDWTASPELQDDMTLLLARKL